MHIAEWTAGTVSGASPAPPRTASGVAVLPPIGPAMNLSDTALFDVVDLALDLSEEGRDLMGAVSGLTSEQIGRAGQLLSDLVKQGVVGYEDLDVNGARRRVDVTVRMADPALRNARPWRSAAPAAPRFEAYA